jgi:predicted RNase H-like nuclease (RuvC/YqgF family)
MITDFFRSRATSFRTRSAERDLESDLMNVERVAKAIDQAITTFKAEREGLDQRLADVTSRAAIVAGNGSDDYHEREKAVSDRLSELDTEVKNAQRRVDRLDHNISQLEFLRDELRSRFYGSGRSAAPDRAARDAPRPAIAP